MLMHCVVLERAAKEVHRLKYTNTGITQLTNCNAKCIMVLWIAAATVHLRSTVVHAKRLLYFNVYQLTVML